MSSIKRNLGLEGSTTSVKYLTANGVAQLMTEVRSTFLTSLSETELFAWHKMLFLAKTTINVGKWRFDKAPMQVISGSIGKEKVHFEAPPSSSMALEMGRFIHWLNNTALESALVKAAIAHLYFERIHPLEDGNGRVGGAIAEKSLFQGLNSIVLINLS
jgi:Fic family protein